MNQDGQDDWLYSNGANPVLVYGTGAVTNQFSGYAGFFAAPGDVDGDQRADILLTDSAGQASLIHQPEKWLADHICYYFRGRRGSQCSLCSRRGRELGRLG